MPLPGFHVNVTSFRKVRWDFPQSGLGATCPSSPCISSTLDLTPSYDSVTSLLPSYAVFLKAGILCYLSFSRA